MPSGWLEDEPAMVNDPNSVMPDDWDEDMDGKNFYAYQKKNKRSF